MSIARSYKDLLEIEEVYGATVGDKLEVYFESRAAYLHVFNISCVANINGERLFEVHLQMNHKRYYWKEPDGRPKRLYCHELMHIFGDKPSVRKLRNIIRAIKQSNKQQKKLTVTVSGISNVNVYYNEPE